MGYINFTSNIILLLLVFSCTKSNIIPDEYSAFLKNKTSVISTLKQVDTPAELSSLATLGSTIYAVNSERQNIAVFDIKSLSFEDNYLGIPNPSTLYATDDKLYVMNKIDDIIYQFDPESLMYSEAYSGVSPTTAFSTRGNMLYVSTSKTVEVLDLSEDKKFCQIYGIGSDISTLAILGNKLYAGRTNNVIMLDTKTCTWESNPISLNAKPTIMASGDTKLYVATDSNILNIINNSDNNLTTIDIKQNPQYLIVIDFILFAAQNNTISVIDTRTDEIIGLLELKEKITGIIAGDKKLFVATENKKLEIFDLVKFLNFMKK